MYNATAEKNIHKLRPVYTSQLLRLGDEFKHGSFLDVIASSKYAAIIIKFFIIIYVW